MSMTKRKITLLAALVCCLSLVAVGTTAYFTAQETAYNVITTAVLDIFLHDETTGGVKFPEDGIDGVMPGQAVDKIVYIENTGSADLYARISLEQIIVAAPGVREQLNFDHITLDINTEQWIERDGWYYYYRALKPGESTEKLFTTVTFGPELGNEYMNAHVEIIVNAQAVQARNNTDSPLTAQGWAAVK